jgi:hypothetical protein
VSLDELKQNFMTLLWNKVTKLVPKSSPQKKLAQSVVDACANLFQRPTRTISLLLFPVPGRYLPKKLGKEVQKGPVLFHQVFFVWNFLVR